MKITSENCQLFKNFSDGEIKEILDLARSREIDYQEGAYIFNEGDPPSHMFILVSGSLVVEKTDINGKNVLVKSFKDPGSIFAEVFIILEGKNFDYSARTTSNLKVLALERNFLDYLKTSPYYEDLLMNFLRLLATKAYYLNSKLIIHSSYSLRQKIASFLIQENPGKGLVKLDYTREDLADYIGSSRPSLSRELSNMEKDGLIKIKGRHIEIIDPHGLAQLT